MYFGEGNGTPLQYFCLEGPVDGGAWQAAVHGVARVGHDWATSLSLFTFMHWRRKWQPTPVSLPGESQGWGSLVGCLLWGRTELDWSDLAAARCIWACLLAQMIKNPPAMQETRVQSQGQEDTQRRKWQPTPVFLPGESPWTKRPGELQSMRSQRVRHDRATKHKHKMYLPNLHIN